MRTLKAALLFWLVLPGLCQAAADPAETACHNKATTIDIAECVGDLTAQWDKRLNRAYQAAQKASENADRKTALTRAERAWLLYRSENCGWYGAVEGTIRQIAGADCMLDMTRSRTLELEAALQP
jgi:uncharacterized protein YecT (DUF1311 family)